MKTLITLFTVLVMMETTTQIDYTLHQALLMDARRALESEDHRTSLDLYQRAFKINGAQRAIEYLNAALSAAHLNDSTNCDKWLRASIVQENITLDLLTDFSDHPTYQRCKGTVLMDYKKLQAYYKIQKLVNRDQFVRKMNDYYMGVDELLREEAFKKLMDPATKKDTAAYKRYQAILFPKTEEVYKEYELTAMRYVDSLNIVELIDITKEHGWQEEAWILLWHQRGIYGEGNWVWDYFKPLIDQEISDGKVSPSFWAEFEDIKSIYNIGKSIYGYHPGRVDAATVNQNRIKIGLPPLTKQEIENRNNNPHGGAAY